MRARTARQQGGVPVTGFPHHCFSLSLEDGCWAAGAKGIRYSFGMGTFGRVT